MLKYNATIIIFTTVLSAGISLSNQHAIAFGHAVAIANRGCDRREENCVKQIKPVVRVRQRWTGKPPKMQLLNIQCDKGKPLPGFQGDAVACKKQWEQQQREQLRRDAYVPSDNGQPDSENGTGTR
ncbi:hypothetical protein ACX27_27450 [Nostoc piscinale CENA21]|uniref:Uncharacterized protein n=1 Tax=Nostoc piscinale CENA21 TaxID=224013 RepID=A0A0M4TY23_9NOSO|nr:hypothetical protein [Nostoc piscinale]ALF55744.1 hypothetical protein ACX27_27450 [Nostoc piscinale CENA21]